VLTSERRRQAQVVNSLTIVATVFLPLSFLTGYFGMNFRILTNDVQPPSGSSSCWACCCRPPVQLCRYSSSTGSSGASGLPIC